MPREDRKLLVERFLRNPQGDTKKELDSAWLVEAERRYQEIESGQTEAIPGDGFFESIRQELGWWVNRSRFMAAVRQGLKDSSSGRLIDDEELGALLDKELGPSA